MTSHHWCLLTLAEVSWLALGQLYCPISTASAVELSSAHVLSAVARGAFVCSRYPSLSLRSGDLMRGLVVSSASAMV